MEVAPFQPYPLDLQFQYYRCLVLFPFYRQENYVHWTETPESHIFSADIPGVRREDIQVEVEDSIYLIIRTDPQVDPTRSFVRKFRLPSRVDMEGISAGYQDGVLTVTVPRSRVFRGFFIDLSELPGSTSELTARAA